MVFKLETKLQAAKNTAYSTDTATATDIDIDTDTQTHNCARWALLPHIHLMA